MPYEDFLARVVMDGLAASAQSYAGDRMRREGAARGFGECLGKTRKELGALLAEASGECAVAYLEERPDYWYWRTRMAEIEWTCNCVSAWQFLTCRRETYLVMPTGSGIAKALSIIGGHNVSLCG